jgi:acetyltransferase-like isoleucine patch superfamily enzyme
MDSASMSSTKLAEITGAWPYTALPSNVRIGENCFFERRDSFGRFRSEQNPGLIIGNRVRVYTWTTFNVEPSGRLEIGDDSVLVGAIFMCADHIAIGRRVVISYNVTIADSDFHPLDPKLRRQDAVANAPGGDRQARPRIVTRPVAIGDDVWVGIGAMILKGVTIGPGARIGPGAVVTGNVPAGAMMMGNPAIAGQWPELL